MSALVSEEKYFGVLTDFTQYQREQTAHWLANSYDTSIGIIDSCRAVVARTDQGSMYYVVDTIIRALLIERTGLDSRRSLEENVAITVVLSNPECLDKLDGHFILYGDGSLMFGYEHTGFIAAHDDSSLVIHPATRFSIQLPCENYDLSYGKNAAISGRTMFMYHLTQACRTILDAEQEGLHA